MYSYKKRLKILIKQTLCKMLNTSVQHLNEQLQVYMLY